MIGIFKTWKWIQTISLVALIGLSACGNQDDDDDDCKNDSDCTATMADYCQGDILVSYTSNAVCNESGICNYETSPQECEFGCAAGACLTAGDLCEEVTCSNPADTCEGEVAITYVGSAACSEGVCDYNSIKQEEDCDAVDQVCANGQCVAPALCAGVECSTSAPDCDGDVALVYEQNSCDEATGECTNPEPTRQNCISGDQVCVEGVCTDPVECECNPPAPICVGNAVETYSEGICEATTDECSYTGTTTDCEGETPFCFDGACTAVDHCENITCEQPTDTCDGNTALTYSDAGTCDAGECDFTTVVTETDCGSDTCLNGVCESGDLCENITCEQPTDTCDGNTALTYSDAGTCDAGECDFTTVVTETDCGSDTCLNGVCESATDLCENVTCEQPTDTCEGNTAFLYGGSGTCEPSSGECNFAPVLTQENCGDEATCLSGACVFHPTAGSLTISEFLANAPGEDDDREWFEIHNNLDRPLVLTGLVVSDEGSNSFTVEGDVVIEADAYFVFAEKMESTPTVHYAWHSGDGNDPFTLSNNDDEIILNFGETEIDRVAYDRNSDTWDLQSARAYQLSSTADFETVDNNDHANWCVAGDAYTIPGSDETAYGTPGTVGYDCANLCYAELCEPEYPICDADDLISHSGNGVCEPITGECDYSAVTDSYYCANDFAGNGICEVDECIDSCFEVICDEQQPSYCDGNELVEFDAFGSCEQGLCRYEIASYEECEAPATCSEASGEAVCVEDLCDGVTCEQRDPFCDGNVAVQDTDSGTCLEADGSCSYSGETRIDCNDLSQMCLTGWCVRAPQPGDLAITEINFDGGGDPDNEYEWFEVLNLTNDALNLNLVLIDDVADDGTNGHTMTDFAIPPNEYVVFASTTNAIPADMPSYIYGSDTVGLNNGRDTLRLVFGGDTLDEVVYDDYGDWPDNRGGYSLSLDPGAATTSANDLGTNWCRNDIFGDDTYAFTTATITQHGTPGARNPLCPRECGNSDDCAPLYLDHCEGETAVTYTGTFECSDGTCLLDDVTEETLACENELSCSEGLCVDN